MFGFIFARGIGTLDLKYQILRLLSFIKLVKVVSIIEIIGLKVLSAAQIVFKVIKQSEPSKSYKFIVKSNFYCLDTFLNRFFDLHHLVLNNLYLTKGYIQFLKALI